MANEAKQDVSVTTKGHEIQKAPRVRARHGVGEWEQLFDRLASRNWLRPFGLDRPLWGELAEPFEGRLPSIDIVDRDEDILVRAEVPGVSKKDVEVSIAGDMLTIKGRTRHEEKEEKGDYYRCEISRGAFSRSVTLPSGVDAEKVKATMKDGMLEIVLPKIEGSRRRAIQVE